MLTHEPVKTLVIWSLSDSMGYFYCADCIDAGCGIKHGGRPEADRADQRSSFDDARCDGCAKPYSDFRRDTIETIETIEHVTCKIF